MNWLKRLYKYVLYPVSSNRVGYLMLLSLAVILTIVSNIGMSNDIFLALLIPLWGAYLTCVIATLLRPIRLHWAVWTVAVFLWLMEIFSVFFYSSLINVRLVKLILEQQVIVLFSRVSSSEVGFAVVRARQYGGKDGTDREDNQLFPHYFCLTNT